MRTSNSHQQLLVRMVIPTRRDVGGEGCNPMNLFSNVYQMGRMSLSTLVLLLSVVVSVWGFLENNLLMGIGGAINGIFAFASVGDSRAAMMIKKEVDKMQIENKKYAQENISLTKSVNNLNDENVKLSKSNELLAGEISRLTGINSELIATKNAFEEQIVNLRLAHEETKKFLRVLVSAGDSYSKFSTKFGESAEKLTAVNTSLESTANDLEKTNTELKMTAELLQKMASSMQRSRSRQMRARGFNVNPKGSSSASSSDDDSA